MKLYDPSILLQDYVSLGIHGETVDVGAIFDNDKRSFVTPSASNPSVRLDAGVTRRASAIWLKVSGYSAVSVQGSGTAGPFSLPANGFGYFEFSEQSSQTWRVDLTGTGSIYEIYLSRKVLDFDNDTDLPQWRMPKFQAIYERTAGGGLISFQPFGFGGGRSKITLKWPLLANVKVDELISVWEAGVSSGGRFGVYPYPSKRPRHFFEARLEGDLRFEYAGLKQSDGQSGSVVFSEVDVGERIAPEP